MSVWRRKSARLNMTFPSIVLVASLIFLLWHARVSAVEAQTLFELGVSGDMHIMSAMLSPVARFISSVIIAQSSIVAQLMAYFRFSVTASSFRLIYFACLRSMKYCIVQHVFADDSSTILKGRAAGMD